MPRALPSSRETSLRAEATPCLLMGREAVIAVVAGVPARPIPKAKTTSAMAKNQYGELASRRLISTKPTVMESRPIGAVRRKPMRSATCGALRATGMRTNGIGSRATAASRGSGR